MAQGKQKFKAQRPGGAKKQQTKPKGLKKGGKICENICVFVYFL